MRMKSFIEKPQNVERKWFIVDAEGKTLGKVASRVASILRGKHKSTFTPHVDCGDYVIVINAEKVEVTGRKRKNKIYKRHTGYPYDPKTVAWLLGDYVKREIGRAHV